MTSEETFDRVLHKTADRHRSDSARDRGYHRSLRLYGSEIDIPAQPAGLGIAVDTHIDNDSPFGHHIASDKLRPPYSHDQDLCLPCKFRQIDCTAVGNRDCRILVQQKLGHGKTDDIAAAHDHRPLTLNGDTCRLQQLDYTFRSAGYRARLFLPQCCHIERMESIHILLFRYGLYHLCLADMLRERELYKNAIYSVIPVQLPYEREKFILRNGLRPADGGVPYPFALPVT